ncbi:MAG: hypothetical protein WC337_01210 [Candidatus Muiribacteriota bacterium]|jgi:thioredoxin-like negative regulator of GroEL
MSEIYRFKKIFIILCVFAACFFRVSADEVEKAFENLKNSPHNAQNHFVVALINFFNNDMEKALENVVNALRLDSSIIFKTDYGMLENLLVYVKSVALKSENFQTRYNGVILLQKIGQNEIARQELKKMLIRTKSSEEELIIRRTLNSLEFLSSL